MPKSSSPATKSENSFWNAEVQLQGPELQLAPETHACLHQTQISEHTEACSQLGLLSPRLGFLLIWGLVERQKYTIPGESQVSRKWGTFGKQTSWE